LKQIRNKTLSFLIAIVLTISIGASTILIPNTTAHTPAQQIPTYAYVQAVPNPVGVGQAALIYMWVDKIPDGAQLGNSIRFQNYQLKITAPDGTVQTQTFPVVQDPTSNQHYSFTPTQVGTYILNFSFPGYTYTYTGLIPGFFGPPAPSAYVGDTYVASTASATMTVQETAIPTIPTVPLPESYWTRPIYGENPNWFTISSNWLGIQAPGYTSGYPGDAVGPLTGHVMWTKPIQSGGVVGGNNFEIQGATFFEGSAYAQRFEVPIIMDGKLYYTEPLSFGGVPGAMSGQPYGPTKCVDLRTGQVIWSRSDVPAPSFGYIYDVHEPNQHGTYPPILFYAVGQSFFATASEWRAYDGDTGDAMFNVTNIPSGTKAMGPNGEYLIYVLANCGPTTMTPFGPVPSGPAQYYLAQWNSSNLWTGQYSGASTTPSVVPPITNGADPRMYDWNISIPSLNTMVSSPSIVDAFTNNMLIGMSGSYPGVAGSFGGGGSSPYTYFGVNLNATKGAVGTILFTNTLQAPAGNITVSYAGADPATGVFAETYKETMQRVGFSMATGQKMWGPVGDQVAFQYYSTTGYYSGGLGGCVLAYGKLYSAGYGGIIYAYDLHTGNLLWTYGNGGAGNSTSMGYGVRGNYPTTIYAIGNGVIYTITTEHTVQTPIYKGAETRGINATDGTEIFTLNDYCGSFATATAAIADGFATVFNGYDNQIYSIGRGPSALTVEAPKTSNELGKSLVIDGTVMDVSAGTKQVTQASNFPNGVPVSSDVSMKDWMGYVYQQKPLPSSFTGVDVTVDVIDSNGNFRNIGTAQTDQTGMYSFTWKPDISGSYKVIATFHGTNGYWPSYSETSFVVDEATTTPSPVATTPANLATTSDLMMYIVGATIAIIIAIAIVGLLLLRKHP
jgi:hypothetical protein